MKAIILAAGKASRLRPLTEEIPKCLLKIGEGSILDTQMKALASTGISDIVLVTGFQAEKIEAYVKSGYPEAHLTFLRNELYGETGAAYSLWLAREHMEDGFLYLNSDLLCDPEIIRLVTEDKRGSVTAIQRTQWDEEEVNVRSGNDMKILEIGKHVQEAESYGEFIGATKFNSAFARSLKEVLDDFMSHSDLKRFAVDAINNAIAIKKETMFALDVTHLTALEIDTPEDYDRAKELWNRYGQITH